MNYLLVVLGHGVEFHTALVARGCQPPPAGRAEKRRGGRRSISMYWGFQLMCGLVVLISVQSPPYRPWQTHTFYFHGRLLGRAAWAVRAVGFFHRQGEPFVLSQVKSSQELLPDIHETFLEPAAGRGKA